MKERTGTIINSISDLLTNLPDDESCRLYLEEVVGVRCPYCYCREKHMKLQKHGHFIGYSCGRCKRRFNNFTGTEFEHSHIPFRKTLIAIFLFLFKPGKRISSRQLANDLGVSQKSAAELLKKIKDVDSPFYRKEMIEKRKEQYGIDEKKYPQPHKDFWFVAN